MQTFRVISVLHWLVLLSYLTATVPTHQFLASLRTWAISPPAAVEIACSEQCGRCKIPTTRQSEPAPTKNASRTKVSASTPADALCVPEYKKRDVVLIDLGCGGLDIDWTTDFTLVDTHVRAENETTAAAFIAIRLSELPLAQLTSHQFPPPDKIPISC